MSYLIHGVLAYVNDSIGLKSQAYFTKMNQVLSFLSSSANKPAALWDFARGSDNDNTSDGEEVLVGRNPLVNEPVLIVIITGLLL